MHQEKERQWKYLPKIHSFESALWFALGLTYRKMEEKYAHILGSLIFVEWLALKCCPQRHRKDHVEVEAERLELFKELLCNFWWNLLVFTLSLSKLPECLHFFFCIFLYFVKMPLYLGVKLRTCRSENTIIVALKAPLFSKLLASAKLYLYCFRNTLNWEGNELSKSWFLFNST